MPALYRSKSVRRLEENNSRLTNFIEKDNTKVLGAAAIQLFISAPHLEKWFKSSTGTICFLKDFTRKSTYYFRLYSLMQGQLWEQEMHSPFIYEKLSYLFHYLTVNRFNFGFKFICEDEAERFFNVISKFSSESNDQLVDANNNFISSSSSSTTTSNKPQTQQTSSSTAQLDSTTTSACNGGNSAASSNLTLTTNASPRSSIVNKFSRRHASAVPLGSIANAAAAVAAAAGVASSSASQSSNQSSTTLASSSSSTIKAAAKSLCSTSEFASNSHKSRRPSLSIDRKRKIEKSEISCPFRCSCTDLHLSNESKLLANNNNNNNYKVVNQNEIQVQLPEKQVQTEPKLILSENSPSIKKDSSTVNKRALSSVPSNQNQSKFLLPPSQRSEKDSPSKKSSMGACNSSSNSSSTSGSPNSLIKSQSIKDKLNQQNNKETIIKTNENTNKLLINNNNNSKLNPIVKNEYVTVCAQSLTAIKNKLATKEEIELEIMKDILIKYDVPINKRVMKILRGYLNQYGDIEKFKIALESEEERVKLSSFIAASSAAFIGKSQQINANNSSQNINSGKILSPVKQTKLQSSNQSIHKNIPLPLTPSSPLKSKQPLSINTPPNTVLINTPTTPTVSANSKNNRYSYTSSYQMLTPTSSITKTNHTYQSQLLQPLERTPIRPSPLASSAYTINSNRTQTPSPSRQGPQLLRQNMSGSTISTPVDANAPPKPPRRSSLKAANIV